MNVITMTKSAMIRARVEPELKDEGEFVLKQLGLSTSEFISMTFRQLIMRQGLPFDARIPNEETIAALKESRADHKAGRLQPYVSSKELFAELDAEFKEESDK